MSVYSTSVHVHVQGGSSRTELALRRLSMEPIRVIKRRRAIIADSVATGTWIDATTGRLCKQRTPSSGRTTDARTSREIAGY